MRRPCRLFVLLALGGVACAGGHRHSDGPPTKDVLIERSTVLEELRRQLEIVRSAKPAQAFEGKTLGVRVLEGAARSEIEAALGPGSICRREMGELCDSVGDAYYSLYHFAEPPPGMYNVGGGPELVLRYAGSDRVEEALWVWTQ